MLNPTIFGRKTYTLDANIFSRTRQYGAESYEHVMSSYRFSEMLFRSLCQGMWTLAARVTCSLSSDLQLNFNVNFKHPTSPLPDPNYFPPTQAISKSCESKIQSGHPIKPHQTLKSSHHGTLPISNSRLHIYRFQDSLYLTFTR